MIGKSGFCRVMDGGSLYFQIDNQDADVKARECAICGEHFQDGKPATLRLFIPGDYGTSDYDDVLGPVCILCLEGKRSAASRRLANHTQRELNRLLDLQRLLLVMPESAWDEVEANYLNSCNEERKNV